MIGAGLTEGTVVMMRLGRRGACVFTWWRYWHIEMTIQAGLKPAAVLVPEVPAAVTAMPDILQCAVPGQLNGRCDRLATTACALVARQRFGIITGGLERVKRQRSSVCWPHCKPCRRFTSRRPCRTAGCANRKSRSAAE